MDRVERDGKFGSDQHSLRDPLRRQNQIEGC